MCPRASSLLDMPGIGAMLVRCPNNLKWLLLMRSTSNSTLNPSPLTPLLTLAIVHLMFVELLGKLTNWMIYGLPILLQENNSRITSATVNFLFKKRWNRVQQELGKYTVMPSQTQKQSDKKLSTNCFNELTKPWGELQHWRNSYRILSNSHKPLENGTELYLFVS